MTTLGDNVMLQMDSIEATIGDKTVYKNWEELAVAVNNWSMANFTSQRGMGCLVPLLGVIEEIDEFESALTPEESEDAIGDILIFLLDYCKRSGMDLSSIEVYPETASGSLNKWIGKLCHARVKRIQGIRGMENIEAFRAKELTAVAGLIGVCHKLAIKETGQLLGAFDLACHTWTNVVAKRKWHTQPDKPITFESSCEDFKNVAAELNWGIN